VITPKAFDLGSAEPVAKVCARCRGAFTVPGMFLAKIVLSCPACYELHLGEERARVEAEALAMRRAAWERLCPAEFRATDPKRLPRPEMFARVLAWKFGARGLILLGATGTGKSRCAWALLEREHMAGRSVATMNHTIALEYQRQFARPVGSVAQWAEPFLRAEVLLLDDVFKARLSDGLEQLLFTIVATRCEKQLPMIVTTNDDSASLAQRLSEDRAEPLLRRLRENCVGVVF